MFYVESHKTKRWELGCEEGPWVTESLENFKYVEMCVSTHQPGFDSSSWLTCRMGSACSCFWCDSSCISPHLAFYPVTEVSSPLLLLLVLLSDGMWRAAWGQVYEVWGLGVLDVSALHLLGSASCSERSRVAVKVTVFPSYSSRNNKNKTFSS